MTANSQPYLPLGDIVLPLPDSTSELLNQLIDSFNFERVRSAMEAVGWTYWGETETPSLEGLRAKARGLLETVAAEKRDGAEIHSGGFRASWHYPHTLVLMFVLESGHASQRSAPGLRSVIVLP